ncbi:MAG: hypothetical protein RJA07_714 [Bacteroidota bacterium]|jgi:hypothetical protein
MKNKIFFTIVLTVLATFIFSVVEAQCPMCGEAARTSLKEGNTTATSLNAGIFYLLMGPYVLLGAGAVIWWRHRKKVQRLQLLNNIEA